MPSVKVSFEILKLNASLTNQTISSDGKKKRKKFFPILKTKCFSVYRTLEIMLLMIQDLKDLQKIKQLLSKIIQYVFWSIK